MKNHHQTIALGLLVGVLAYSSLEFCQFQLAHFTSLYPDAMMDPPAFPGWSHIIQQVLTGIQAVGPGVLAGWLAKQSGISVGAATGVLGCVGAQAVLTLLIGPGYVETVEAPWILGAITYAAIPSAVGGVAGVAFRQNASSLRAEERAAA